MKNCIDCNKPTNSTQRIRCVDCNVIKRKLTAKTNKDKYQYHKQPKYRYAVYKRGAENRGYSFELSVDEFSNLWNKPCHYCNVLIQGIGIDRKDNNIGYTVDNTVACCTDCNFMKHKTDYNQFINQCILIAENFLSHRWTK
jgi:hypothetical protein